MMEQLRQLKPVRENLLPDLLAGLTVALINIPNGMAYALLAGVNPLYGLYSAILTPIVAAILTGSVFMVVTISNEMALVTAGVIDDLGLQIGQIRVVFMLMLMVGLWQIIFAALRLGTMLRFISLSVMTGFVAGTAVLVILGQLDQLTGYEGEATNTFVVAVETLLNPDQWDIPTTVIGLSTIGLIILLNRTRLRRISLIIALVVMAVVVALADWNSVQVVGDLVDIPSELPQLTLPDFRYVVPLFIPSLAMAVLGVAVTAGVAQSHPNPDGHTPDANRNFLGVGAGNVVGSFFQGLPADGSLSRTAHLVNAGARSRWAVIISGLVVALVVVAFASAAEKIPLAAIAGLLIYTGVSYFNTEGLARSWQVNTSGRVAMSVTFVLTLIVPLQSALLIGIGISLLLYIYETSLDVRVVELVPLGNGRFEERDAPAKYPSNQVTVVSFYGSPFFAAIETMERGLPATKGIKNVAVVFIVRELDNFNNTFLDWLEHYVKELHKSGSTFFLAELTPTAREQIDQVKAVEIIGPENLFIAQPVIGASIEEALTAAETWLEQRLPETKGELTKETTDNGQ